MCSNGLFKCHMHLSARLLVQALTPFSNLERGGFPGKSLGLPEGFQEGCNTLLSDPSLSMTSTALWHVLLLLLLLSI